MSQTKTTQPTSSSEKSLQTFLLTSERDHAVARAEAAEKQVAELRELLNQQELAIERATVQLQTLVDTLKHLADEAERRRDAEETDRINELAYQHEEAIYRAEQDEAEWERVQRELEDQHEEALYRSEQDEAEWERVQRELNAETELQGDWHPEADFLEALHRENDKEQREQYGATRRSGLAR